MVDVRHPWMVAWLVLVWVEISIGSCFFNNHEEDESWKDLLGNKSIVIRSETLVGLPKLINIPWNCMLGS